MTLFCGPDKCWFASLDFEHVSPHLGQLFCDVITLPNHASTHINSKGVEFDFFELHEMAPENVAMVLIKYLQALPEPIYSAKYEAHFKLAIGTFSGFSVFLTQRRYFCA